MSNRKRNSFVSLLFTLFVMQQLFSYVSIPVLNDLDDCSIELIGEDFQDDSDENTDGQEENDSGENEEESQEYMEFFNTSYVFSSTKVNSNFVTPNHNANHLLENPFSPPELIN